MTPRLTMLLALGGLAAITALGTIGYVLVEDMDWVEALYMTVITISTVGYGEVRPLSSAGRLFTVGLILTAVAAAAYLLTLLARTLVEVSLRELFTGNRMLKKITGIENHVILCGFGRFGRIVAEELQRNGVELVILEASEARERELTQLEVPFLIGSAVNDENLIAAGIERAAQIVIATGSDSDNVFIALSARELNPKIRIHARGESDAAMRRLKRAGAHHVISAYQMGGVRMATSILRPSVVDFLEIARPRFGEEVDLEEIRVFAGSELCGEPIRQLELRTTRLRIVALKRGAERIQLVPEEDTEIHAGDHLVVIGERGSLEKLSRLATDESTSE